MEKIDIAVIGGGAAGYFAAIAAKRSNSRLRVVILEKSARVLEKVRISGGGRCNVTHNQTDVRLFASGYPRGSRELLSAFSRFGQRETLRWFTNEGVQTHAEEDGRMFPVSNSSLSIVNALVGAANQAGVELRLKTGVELIEPREAEGDYLLSLSTGDTVLARRVILAGGSSPHLFNVLQKMGLQMVSQVPSLFTFRIDHELLADMAGVSFPGATVNFGKLKQSGPVLITHWGLSGPAVLRLSAFAARELSQCNYKFTFVVQFTECSKEETLLKIHEARKMHGKQLVINGAPFFQVPQRWYRQAVLKLVCDETKNWSDLSGAQINAMANTLSSCQFDVSGKSTNKDEFVTAGGIDLKEVDFRTFGLKRWPGLFAAGEILNIDGITGGYNFQAAWTSGFLSGEASAQNL